MRLFADIAVDEVTIQDIASEVDMTPAAVYYHFAAKEQILIEGMQQFRDRLLGELRSRFESEGSTPPDVLVRTLTWASRHRPEATVYFVKSIGLNQTVEALRREARVEMVGILRAALAETSGVDDAESGVVAVALVSLLETSMAAMLNRDPAFRGLGAKRFRSETAAIAERVVGLR